MKGLSSRSKPSLQGASVGHQSRAQQMPHATGGDPVDLSRTHGLGDPMTAPFHQNAALARGPEQELRGEPVDRMTSVGHEHGSGWFEPSGLNSRAVGVSGVVAEFAQQAWPCTHFFIGDGLCALGMKRGGELGD